MATKQHIYRGDGSPQGVVSAPVGSHYIDDSSEYSWIAVSNYIDGEGVERTYWDKPLVDTGLPLEVDGTLWLIGDAEIRDEVVLLAGGEVGFSAVSTIYTNATIQLESDGRARFLTGGEPHLYRAWGAGDGRIYFIVTPLTPLTLSPPST